MSQVDLKQVAQDVAAWSGRFYVADEGEGAASVCFASADGDVEVLDSTGEVDDACAPIARMLNAVPLLLAEVERLRSLGRNACELVLRGVPVGDMGARDRAKELLAEIERKETP